MMHEFSYLPGSVPTAIGRAGVAMVRTPDAAPALSIHRQARSVYDAVDLLAGLGFSVLPEFVLSQVDLEVIIVLVRGDFVVTVDGPDGRQMTDGRDTDRWIELRIPRSVGHRVFIGPGGSQVGTMLPVHAGVVMSDGVVLAEGARSFGPADSVDIAVPVTQPAAEASSAEAPETVVDLAAELALEIEPAPEWDPKSGPEPEPEPELEPEPEPSAGETRFDAEDDRFSAAFGRTIMGRRPEDAAVRDVEEQQRGFRIGPPPVADDSKVQAVRPPSIPGGVSVGDHDGQTMTPEQFAAMRADASAAATAAVAPTGRRPIAAFLLSTTEIALDTTVVLGRSPQARQASSADVPRLVTIDNPYVSGTHIEIRFEGNEYRVTDLSRNGTLIKFPGEQPRALPPGVPTPLVDGCELELTEGLIGAVRIERR